MYMSAASQANWPAFSIVRHCAPPLPVALACTCAEPAAGGVKLACQREVPESKLPFSIKLGGSLVGGSRMVSKNAAMAWLANEGPPWLVLPYVGSSCSHHQSPWPGKQSAYCT